MRLSQLWRQEKQVSADWKMENSRKSQKTASLFQAIKMVLSAFIGIRKQGSQQEKIKVTPMQVVITGIIMAALFALTVRTIVHLVLGK